MTESSSPREAYGTLEKHGTRNVLSFTLPLPYPIAKVWEAVSVPETLGKFFPGAAPWTPAAGEQIDVGGMPLEVHQVQAPTLLDWSFAGERQTFTLESTGSDSCTLTFRHEFENHPIAQTATGWQCYLSRLEPLLAGGYLDEMQAHKHWREIHEGYAAKFDVDPGPGRAWADQFLPSES